MIHSSELFPTSKEVQNIDTTYFGPIWFCRKKQTFVTEHLQMVNYHPRWVAFTGNWEVEVKGCLRYWRISSSGGLNRLHSNIILLVSVCHFCCRRTKKIIEDQWSLNTVADDSKRETFIAEYHTESSQRTVCQRIIHINQLIINYN